MFGVWVGWFFGVDRGCGWFVWFLFCLSLGWGWFGINGIGRILGFGIVFVGW